MKISARVVAELSDQVSVSNELHLLLLHSVYIQVRMYCRSDTWQISRQSADAAASYGCMSWPSS